MSIQYYSKQVYGQTMLYLANTKQAMQWNSISGKKTITQSEMNVLASLTGATFERVFEAEA